MSIYKQKLNPRTGQFNLVPSAEVLVFKTGVATFADLPASGNNPGDARITNDTGHLYVWDGIAWQDQGDIVDLNWSAINGKPSSSPANIDEAVAEMHISGSELQIARPAEVAYNPIYPLNDPLVSAQRSILFFPAGFNVGGLGTSYKYVMIWANDWFNILKVSGSNDFKTWTYITDLVGVNTGSHPAIVQLSPTSFRLYYLNGTFISTIADLRTATSSDLVNFSDEQQIQTDPLHPIVTAHDPDWNRNSYGIGCAIYNPTATNVGSDPRNYSFMAYFDGSNGAFESIGLAYSADGITYSLYGTDPILDHSTSTWGDNLIWDSSYATAPQVIKINSKYLMFYCGGITTVLEGIGSAISDDGLVWKKISVNHPTICPTWGAWNHTACSFPTLVMDLATRFAGAGELADVKMMVTGGVEADWTYSNGAYVIPYLMVPVEESIYHIEPYCLPEQKASAITNDSSVSGATVKNALETLSAELIVPVTNTLYVDNKRVDTYTENGSIAKPFKTIQAAINAVTSPSATNKYLIDIAPGAYYTEALTVNKIFVTFRSCGLNGARISGKITITNPADPTPEQITFVGLRLSGGLECVASHICINVVDCSVSGADWVMNPTVSTDDEYLQIFPGIWYANAVLTNVYTYIMGGGIYSTFTVTNKEFNINNADINEPFEALLSGTVVGSAFGNRAGNSKFTLNTGANLHIDADTEGGSIITMAGGTLTRSTKGGNISNDSSVSGTTVKDALETLGVMVHTQGTDQYLDQGGANEVAVADVKDAVDKKHTQGTDPINTLPEETILDAEDIFEIESPETPMVFRQVSNLSSWLAAASDADGSNLIAGRRRLYTSSDSGNTWVERQPAGDVGVSWECVASDATGTILLAGIENGRLYISYNSGVAWSEIQPAGDVNRFWEGVASDADGSNLIAGCGSGTGRLYISTDSGSTWAETQPAGDVNKTWKCVASDSDGSNLIAGVLNGRVYTSIDGGVNWTQHQPGSNVDMQWYSVASDADGSNLIAGNTERLYRTGNGGANWVQTNPDGDVNRVWGGVASDNDGSTLIAGSWGMAGKLYISTDSGVTWTHVILGLDVPGDWYAVASDSDGSNLLVGNYGEYLYASASPTIFPKKKVKQSTAILAVKADTDIADALTKKHTQNTDQYLDFGGANQISAADVKSGAGKLSAGIAYIIDTAGSDITGDGSVGNPFATIAHALSLLPKNLGGYTANINLNTGTYNEEGISVKGFYNGTLAISGAGNNVTIQESSQWGIFAIYGNTANITLSSLHLRVNENDAAALDIEDTSNITLFSITYGKGVSNTGTIGVYLYNTTCRIETNGDIDTDKVDYGIYADLNSKIVTYATSIVPFGTALLYPDSTGMIMQEDKNLSILGELSIKVYSQNDEPTLTADNRMAIWIDTNDSNRVYLLFRRGTGDQVAVELTA